jgi:glycosyltransferase involved in cell wall biosynthesis
MISPLFSIIIPIYNSSHTIGKTINSVLRQTYRNYEIIIIDDGSTDNTLNILKKIKDKRIRIFKIKRSGGPAKPRNYGISKSKSNWICFLDSDDLWEKNKLSIISKQIKKKNFDILCHNEYLCSLNKINISKYGPFKKNFYKNLLINGNSLSTSAVTVSKKFLKKNNLKFNESKKFVSVEDYDLWMLIANKKANFLFIDDVLGTYIIHDKGISQNNKKHLNNLKNLLKNHVYHVQNFESNKKSLWLYFEKKIYLLSLFDNFKKNKSITKTILSILNLCLLNPIFLMNFLIRKLF